MRRRLRAAASPSFDPEEDSMETCNVCHTPYILNGGVPDCACTLSPPPRKLRTNLVRWLRRLP